MTTLPIFVSGLARCGTSLCMQMLQAADVPCLGEFPAFEPDCVGFNRSTAALLDTRGFAMKIIDPHVSKWPHRFNAKIIWLSRNVVQQAKSQVKFINLTENNSIPGQAWRAIAKSLKADRWKCVEWWNSCVTEPLFLSFEDLVGDPLTSSRRLAGFLDIAPDIQAMRECVLDRPIAVQKDMRIETALCRSVDVAQRYGTSRMMAARRILAVTV